MAQSERRAVNTRTSQPWWVELVGLNFATNLRRRLRGFYLRAVPTQVFAGYLFVLAVMWYAAASQANGAAYLLFFMLLAVVLVSLPHTIGNVRGLKVTAGSPKPVF